MALTKMKLRAVLALSKAREKRYKLREISQATGVSISVLSNMDNGILSFSDDVAGKVIAGCKALGRKP